MVRPFKGGKVLKIEMSDIKKSFGANQVLQHVDFTVKSGEVHALMGENGAGKSTLMNVLTGLLKKDGGSILVDGKETSYSNILEAEKNGISFIHQEMNNFSLMSVVENMFLNREIKNKFGILDQKKMKKEAKRYLNKLGTDVDLDVPIGTLSVGKQQMIEIAKSLMTKAKIIIMDEPTAALTGNETRKLFSIINELKAQDVGFIYISHRIEEIFKLCDKVTVMRDGITVNTYPVSKLTERVLVHDMVGREMENFYPDRDSGIGKEVLQVESLSGGQFKDISFNVHEGEILGFSGLMGAGRTEIMRAIFGIDKFSSGEVYLDGKKVAIKSPNDAIKHGIGFLTEDRKSQGLILNASISDNIVLPSIDGFKKHGIIDDGEVGKFVDMLMKRLTVKAQDKKMPVKSLSGGNQQKVVLAKWVGGGSRVLILDEPTRGVDIGAKREIYDLMNELSSRHVAIILVSSDLPEVMSMSDRIEVVYEGKINGEVLAKDADQEKIMTLATGGKIDE